MVAGGASVPEIVPTLKPVGRPTKRAFDPATFGDISEEVNCGQGEMMLALAKAVRERRPEAEIENISADITRKGEEWLQKSREEFRKLPENKGKSDAELEEKFEGRRELLEAVAQSRELEAHRETLSLQARLSTTAASRLPMLTSKLPSITWSFQREC